LTYEFDWSSGPGGEITNQDPAAPGSQGVSAIDVGFSTASSEVGDKEVWVTCTVTGTVEGIGVDQTWDTEDDEEFPLENSGISFYAHMTVVGVDLDVVGTDDDLTIGGLVVRNCDGNNAPRKQIILSAIPEGFQGNVILSRNNTKVKVYDAAAGGNEITFNGTDNKFAGATLPKSLYVEGNTASTTMRDVTLELSVEGTEDAKDTVKFTVLWVQVSGRHTPNDDFSSDNSRISKIQSSTWPSTAKLGSATIGLHPNIPIAYDSGICLLSEFVGDVSPANFQRSDFSEEENILCMKRTLVEGKYYDGEDGDQLFAYNVNDDDTELGWQDTDPQSGGSQGKIYDYDGPGLGNLFERLGNGEIVRARVNYVQEAEYDGIRCSNKYEWYSCWSVRATEDFDLGDLTAATTTTVTDDTKEWDNDHWVPGLVEVASQWGKKVRRVEDNNSDTLSLVHAWTLTPQVDDPYKVIHMDTWERVTDCGADDNKNDDGDTALTWNLEE